MPKLLKHLLVTLLPLLLAPACQTSQPEIAEQAQTTSPATEKANYRAFNTPGDLQNYLRWTPDRRPLISAHRGGPLPGFPENALETFENILNYAPCMIECDVRETEEGILILMHDETLDRTTTGGGEVDQHSLAELKRLFLKDNDGQRTNFRIPTLAEALDWARGRAIIQLDVKRGVNRENVVKAVEKANAESYAMIITYTLPAALQYYQMNNDLMISATARGPDGVGRLAETAIPARNLVVFTGVSEPQQIVFDELHRRGIRAIVGTMGNIDRSAARRGAQVYRKLLQNGADILATDNVILATEAIR